MKGHCGVLITNIVKAIKHIYLSCALINCVENVKFTSSNGKNSETERPNTLALQQRKGSQHETQHPAGTAVISADFAGISNFSFSFRAFPVGHIGKSEDEISRIKLKF